MLIEIIIMEKIFQSKWGNTFLSKKERKKKRLGNTGKVQPLLFIYNKIK